MFSESVVEELNVFEGITPGLIFIGKDEVSH